MQGNDSPVRLGLSIVVLGPPVCVPEYIPEGKQGSGGMEDVPTAS